jgi:hypothetical protein
VADNDPKNNAVAIKAQLELDRSAFQVCSRHFAALFIKRAHYAKRDTKAVVFQLLIPIAFLIIGFVILQVQQSTTYASKVLGVSGFNQPLRVPFNAAGLSSAKDGSPFEALVCGICMLHPLFAHVWLSLRCVSRRMRGRCLTK